MFLLRFHVKRSSYKCSWCAINHFCVCSRCSIWWRLVVVRLLPFFSRSFHFFLETANLIQNRTMKRFGSMLSTLCTSSCRCDWRSFSPFAACNSFYVFVWILPKCLAGAMLWPGYILCSATFLVTSGICVNFDEWQIRGIPHCCHVFRPEKAGVRERVWFPIIRIVHPTHVSSYKCESEWRTR